MYLGPYELGPNDTPENGIYTGDARVLSQAIPDESVDLVLTDPPYNLGKQYGVDVDDNLSRQEFGAFVDCLMHQALRIGKTVLLTPGIANLMLYLRHAPRWILAWHKPFGVSHSPVGFNNWEPVLFWGKWVRNHYSDYVYAPLHLNDKRLGLHECPKPLALMEKLIERYSNTGDVIFDPFVGSGTTAVAARKLGRHYLAFEIMPDVAEQARKRVQETQPPLFVLTPEQMPLDLSPEKAYNKDV